MEIYCSHYRNGFKLKSKRPTSSSVTFFGDKIDEIRTFLSLASVNDTDLKLLKIDFYSISIASLSFLEHFTFSGVLIMLVFGLVVRMVTYSLR